MLFLGLWIFPAVGRRTADVSIPSATTTSALTSAASVTPVASEKPKDPYDASPLHGFLPPMFTALRMPVCAPLHGEFCPYMSCAASAPETQSSGKLWNAYVVPGKDGPVVICEWRESYLQLR